MKVKKVEIELTKDWNDLSKGDVITCSRDIANIHISELNQAKPYIKKKAKKVKS